MAVGGLAVQEATTSTALILTPFIQIKLFPTQCRLWRERPNISAIEQQAAN